MKAMNEFNCIAPAGQEEKLKAIFDKKGYIDEKDELRALFDSYGYVDEKQEDVLNEIRYGGIHLVSIDDYSSSIYEMAKLAKTLRLCEKVEIRGTITNPQTDMDIKGQLATADICTFSTFMYLDYFLSSLIKYQRSVLYQERFLWESSVDRIFHKYIHGLDHLYTEDQLEKIIEYETKVYLEEKRTKPTLDQYLGKKFSQAEKIMLQAGFFSGESKGKAREYAFIYDFFVATRKISVPKFEMTNSEKFDHVKECIETHQNYLEKIKKLNKKRIKNILLNWNNSWKK